MKSSVFALFTAASLASAQFSGVPACAQPCLTSAISQIGCPIADVGCQCSSTAAIQAAGAGCIIGACTAPGDLNSAISGGQALCVAYLATVSASATGTGSAPSTTEATTTVRSTSTATSTVTVETTDISSPTPSSTGFSNSTTSTVVVGTTSTRVSTTSGPASTSQVPVGAGEKVGVAAYMGGVLGLAVAMLAL